MEPHKLTIDDVKDIIILNYELKIFLYNIVDTITYFIDDDYDGITINFKYNNYSFDLYKDYDVKKLSIINKDSSHYEFFYENHEEILIKKCYLKTVSVAEMYDLLEIIIKL